MANIKISELNALTERADNDLLAIVDTSADETKKIQVYDLINKNIELIAVSDIAPSECSIGDKYYNTTDKEIYTATAMNTWSETGTTPISGILYIVYNEQASYSWDGTDLVSVGGGKEDIVISDTEPTDENVKLWIDTGEIRSQASEITDEYSESTGLGYSANYINNLHTYSTDEVRVGTWIDGKPLYRKALQGALTNTTRDRINTGLNISKITIIKFDGYINDTGGGVRPLEQLYIYNNITNFTTPMFFKIGTTWELNFWHNVEFADYTYTIFIEYTKTTD